MYERDRIKDIFASSLIPITIHRLQDQSSEMNADNFFEGASPRLRSALSLSTRRNFRRMSIFEISLIPMAQRQMANTLLVKLIWNWNVHKKFNYHWPTHSLTDRGRFWVGGVCCERQKLVSVTGNLLISQLVETFACWRPSAKNEDLQKSCLENLLVGKNTSCNIHSSLGVNISICHNPISPNSV